MFQRVADLFFCDTERVLKNPSQNPAADRLQTMRQILDTIREFIRKYCEQKNNAWKMEVSAGELEYMFSEEPGSCYDGGCCDDWPTLYYLCTEIVTDDAMAKERKKTVAARDYFACRYQEEHPESRKGMPVYVEQESVYMIHPFETAINLRFWAEIHA